jgi:hypothetical protein
VEREERSRIIIKESSLNSRGTSGQENQKEYSGMIAPAAVSEKKAGQDTVNR